MEGKMILGKNDSYELDSMKTGLNNHVCVVGASGSGKTRGIVIPNLLEAVGSYIVTDPKGNLYSRYANYLRGKGYIVKKLDFTNPKESAHYNFFRYIRNEQDVYRLAHMLVQREDGWKTPDPFWDDSSKLFVASIIGYLFSFCDEESQSMESILKLIPSGRVYDLEDDTIPLDILMEDAEKEHPENFAVETYNRLRIAANKTMRSIIVSLAATIGMYGTPGIMKMMQTDDIDIRSIGSRKTALFVVVSDTDRSMDRLVNIFFTQAMQELCRFADRECKNYRLPVPVRFIMDDFATNCTITDLPRMISSIRSREISVMLMVQSEAQLEARYGKEGRTIITNCDSYVYMGGSDIDTAQTVSIRCDCPLQELLNMPKGKCWILRRGEKPVYTDIAQPKGFIKITGRRIGQETKRAIGFCG